MIYFIFCFYYSGGLELKITYNRRALKNFSTLPVKLARFFYYSKYVPQEGQYLNDDLDFIPQVGH